jgi:hypothetical protein
MTMKFPPYVFFERQKLAEVRIDTILEHELIDNLANEAVDYLRVVQVDNGFRIYSKLTWKDAEVLLVTQRKTPKEWVSLDRLTRHMNHNYGDISPVFLHLKEINQ